MQHQFSWILLLSKSMKRIKLNAHLRNMMTILCLRAKLYTNLNIIETVCLTESTKTVAHKNQ